MTRSAPERDRAPRVLVVAPQPFYEDRGTPIAVLQLLQALVNLGYRADLLTYAMGQTIPLDGVRYFRCANPLRIASVPIGFSSRKVVLDVTLVVELRRLMRHNRYQFVHAVEEAAFAAVILARRHRIPVIYDMQSAIPEQMAKRRLFRLWPLSRGLRAAERWLLRRADTVISSAGLATRVNRIVPAARVREWRYASPVTGGPPGDVIATRREMGLSDHTPAIVYCGNFAPYQGVTELLAALPLVRRDIPGARLVLIGATGEEGLAIRHEITARRLINAVTLVPRQSRDQVPRFLAAADVLVSPRLYGGNLPLKVFDYLAAGRPIVATDIPTHRSVLNEELAELVPPRAASLAQAIVRVLRDRTHGESLARRSREYAERNLGWIGFVESVRDLYSEAHANEG